MAEPRVIADWSDAGHRYVVAPGRYTAEIGESARDVAVSAPVMIERQTLTP